MLTPKPERHEMSDRAYIGANPVYQQMPMFEGGPMHWVKVKKGVPFRRHVK